MRSIKTKLLFVIILILFVFAGTLMLANAFLLDDYYVYKTKDSFTEVAKKVGSLYENDNILDIIREIDTETGYKLVIANKKSDIIYSSVPEFKENEQTKIGEYQREIISRNTKNTDSLLYYGIGYDNNKETSFIISISKLNNSEFLIITLPLTHIIANAKVANDFFLIIGTIMLIITSIISLMFASKLVKPILEITKIADSIAKLDFSDEYKGAGNDEISQLGNSINNISQRLDSTINELKLNNDKLISEMKLQKRFIASVSHEFNTPVGLIRGYTEALDKRMYDSELERKEIINIIIKEADRLNRLVNDILLVLRFDSISFKLKRVETDICELIKDNISKLTDKFEYKNIKITNRLEKNIILDIDPVRITQVVDNLLLNGINYTNENGEIRISSQVNDKCYKFNISNTGSYIADEDKIHLFEAFYRTEDSRNRNKGGNGLGLSIVAGIISAHGGTYGVNDIIDGVNFWFTLPQK